MRALCWIAGAMSVLAFGCEPMAPWTMDGAAADATNRDGNMSDASRLDAIDVSDSAADTVDAISVDTPDVADVIDVPTTPFDLALEVRIGPPPLRAGAGVSVIAENSAGSIYEATTDSAGIAHLTLDPAAGPWDVTAALHGYGAVSVLHVVSPLRDFVRLDPLGSRFHSPPARIAGNIRGAAPGHMVQIDSIDFFTVNTASTSYSTQYEANDSSVSLELCGLEFDASGAIVNSVLTPAVTRSLSGASVDVNFPSPAVPAVTSTQTLRYPTEGLFTVASSPTDPPQVWRVSSGNYEPGYTLVGSAEWLTPSGSTRPLRIQHLTGSLMPTAVLTAAHDPLGSLQLNYNATDFTDGAIIDVPTVRAIVVNGSSLDDVTLVANTTGFDSVGFMIDTPTTDYAAWRVYSQGEVAFDGTRGLPHLPRGFAPADLGLSGYARVIGFAIRMQPGHIAPWATRSFNYTLPEQYQFTAGTNYQMLATTWTRCVGACACAAGTISCGGSCIDNQFDNANCGTCGHACGAGEHCYRGSCAGCGPGTSWCGSSCIATDSDPMNCGGCAVVCPPGLACTAGTCGMCSGGTVACRGTCIDVSSDPSNCGACGNWCASGRCIGGSCACATGLTMCGGTCSDLSTDPMNCGTCSHGCSAFEQCVGGTCVCAPGSSVCGGRCIDTSSDPSNCGGCGVTCPSSAPACSAGTCSLCGSGMTSCGGRCVFTDFDRYNCGACGVTCPPALHCSSGVCNSCPPFWEPCGGTCRYLSYDPANCGACGNVCPPGVMCIGGSCTPGCPTGQTLCGTTCVDTSTDTSNCGACGAACPPGSPCSGGMCYPPCPSGTAFCGGSCANLATDPRNCGACGVSCSSTCVGGVCT